MRYASALLVAIFIEAACSPSEPGVGAPGAADTEAWREATMTDVVTGTEFAIADLGGKVVAIEAMAIWCTTCRFQQLAAREALDRLGSDDVVYISVDVDSNERAEDLAAYAEREGFEWRFVVAGADLSRSLAASFGEQVLSPPATPLIVLAPSGEVVAQHIGITSADRLVALFGEHLP